MVYLVGVAVVQQRHVRRRCEILRAAQAQQGRSDMRCGPLSTLPYPDQT